jgi:hypothetical protein
MQTALEELTARFQQLSPEEIQQKSAEITAFIGDRVWYPQEGPQTEALLSDAFVLLYGGSAGSGKTDLGIGAAMTEHKRALLIRRQFTDLKGLTDRSIQINGTRDGFNGSSPPRLNTRDNRLLMFGSAKDENALMSLQGIPRDLLYVEEAAQLPEHSIKTLIGWTRSNDPDQRCRVILGSNPPLSDEGAWMAQIFAPWLDPTHPNPAEPGELRWFCTDHYGEDVAVPGPGVYEYNDEGYPVLSKKDENDNAAYRAQSRTFVPARLKDNKFLLDTGYKQVLDNMPEPQRSALRDGNFAKARQDAELQLIPSDWIAAAQARWEPHPPDMMPQTCMGVDVAQGGMDRTIIARRHAGWYDELIDKPGRETPDGKSIAGLVMQHRMNMADIVIDMGGGYGGSAYEQLASNLPVYPETGESSVHKYKGSEKSNRKTVQGGLPFYNKRAEAYYRFREALDPGQPGGSDIALPTDDELFRQLCSIRLKEDDATVLQLEPKVNLVKRIGKSPDKADAVVMAWSRGGKPEMHYNVWNDYRGNQRGIQKVIKPKRCASRYKR